MSKKIHRYVRAVAPITKRFGCTLMQAGDYVEKLLGFEKANIELGNRLDHVNKRLTEAEEKLSELSK